MILMTYIPGVKPAANKGFRAKNIMRFCQLPAILFA